MFITKNREETVELGKKLASASPGGTIISLNGGLGAGKTTFVQGIALGLEVEEIVTSPTFVILAEYLGIRPLYHFDLYRISGIDEFYALGAEEQLFGDGISAIEWSERIAPILPEKRVTVTIEIGDGPDVRRIKIEGAEL